MSGRLSRDQRLAMLRNAAQRAGVARVNDDNRDDFSEAVEHEYTPTAAPDLPIEVTDENGRRRIL